MNHESLYTASLRMSVRDGSVLFIVYINDFCVKIVSILSFDGIFLRSLDDDVNVDSDLERIVTCIVEFRFFFVFHSSKIGGRAKVVASCVSAQRGVAV